MKNNKPGCTPIVFGILGIIISIELLFKFHKWILGIIPTVFSWGDLYVSDNTRYVSYVLGGIALIISLIFFYRIWTQRSTKKAMKLGLLSLLVSCCMYMSLYIVSPSYTFKEHPYIFGYMGVRGEYIEYPRYYLWLVDNLGFYGETYKPFETLDDAILGLEYAKKNNNGMYEYIFSDLKSFGLLNVVQNIKEDDLYEDIMFEIIGVDYRDGKYNWGKKV